MGDFKEMFLQLCSNKRKSFDQLSISNSATRLVLLLSCFQTFGSFMYFNKNTSNFGYFQRFASPTSFLLFLDNIYGGEAVVFCFAIQLCFLIYFSLQMFSFASYIVDTKSGTKKEIKKPMMIDFPVIGTISIIFNHVLLQPLVDMSLFSFICNSGLNLKGSDISIQTAINFCFSLKSDFRLATQIISGFNLFFGILHFGIFVLFIYPRHYLIQNPIFHQSRTLDICIGVQKLFLGVSFALRMIPNNEIQIAFCIVNVFVCIIIFYIVCNSITFNNIESVKNFISARIFEILIIVLQSIKIFWTYFSSNNILHKTHFLLLVSVFAFISLKVPKIFILLLFRDSNQKKKLTKKCLLRYFLIYRYADENWNGTFIAPNEDSPEEIEEINTYLFRHFASCKLGKLCICQRLKNGEKVRDIHLQTSLDPPENLSTDDIIRFVCNLKFVKFFLKQRFENEIKNRACSNDAKLFYLQFCIVEENNFSLSSQLMKTIDAGKLSLFEYYEVIHLKNVMNEQLNHTTNHKFTRKEYLNCEKFVRLSKYIEKLETCIVTIVEDFFNTLSAIVVENGDFQRKKENIGILLKKTEENFKNFKEMIKEIPKNLLVYKMIRIFLKYFCNDEEFEFMLRLQVQKTAKQISISDK